MTEKEIKKEAIKMTISDIISIVFLFLIGGAIALGIVWLCIKTSWWILLLIIGGLFIFISVYEVYDYNLDKLERAERGKNESN